jgi:uncharacterized protein DUF3833
MPKTGTVYIFRRPFGPRTGALTEKYILSLFLLLLPLVLLLLAAAPAPVPGPEQFFVGRTEGAGTISVIMSGRHKVRDRSRGRMAADGALLLDQIVEEEGKPARTRHWRLVRAGGNRISGTISDARGPVAGEVAGQVLHLRYRSAEGPSVEQWIILHPDGRTARNRMVFRKFGLKVATMESTIRRVE